MRLPCVDGFPPRQERKPYGTLLKSPDSTGLFSLYFYFCASASNISSALTEALEIFLSRVAEK